MPVKKKKTASKKKLTKKKIVKRASRTIKRKKPAPKRIAKRIVHRKAAKAKRAKPKTAAAKPAERGIIGKVTHYFPHVNAAVVKLNAPLKIGDTIRIKGHTTDLSENVSSIQINRAPINEAKRGDEIGLLVTSRVRAGDKVYKK